MLLCCVYSCEFNYLEDVWIQNIDIIWHQTLFYTDKSTIDCTLYTGIPIKSICRYILETMGTILIHLDTIHDIHYIWVYQKTVFISIFQRPWELYHFTLSLFSVHYIRVYRWNVSVGIFRDYEKCLLLNAMIINDLLTIHFF